MQQTEQTLEERVEELEEVVKLQNDLVLAMDASLRKMEEKLSRVCTRIM